MFVLFLDLKHVEGDTSRRISQTLVNALNRLIGPDDYVGGDDAADVRARHHVRAPADVDREAALARLVGRTRLGELQRSGRESSTRCCYPGVPVRTSRAADTGIARR